MRGAQIDPVLCFLTTFSLYALLRHLLLGPGLGLVSRRRLRGGPRRHHQGRGFPAAAGADSVLPDARISAGTGLAPVDGGQARLALVAGGRWRMLVGDLPVVRAHADRRDASGAPEYAAYRDEILFKQTVGRYAAAWHHVKPWYYFIVEVIPALWVPWSLLLFWLVPRFRTAFRERDARVWLPLSWVLLVLLFFSLSPGKRGVYILPALPALAIASLPFIEECWRGAACGARG